MSRKKIIFVVLLILLGIVAFLFPNCTENGKRKASFGNTTKNDRSEASVNQKPERASTIENKISEIFSAPISFFGKVVDEDGRPIQGASVQYVIADRLYESGNSFSGVSGADGRFSISGLRGATLGVAVRKSGFHFIDGQSSRTFAFGVPADSTRNAPPKESDPAVFVLRKMGESQPLLHVKARQIDLPKDGTPTKIDIETGRVGKGILEVQSFVGNTDAKPYPWKLKITVKKGGVVEKNDGFDFQAPSDGYRESVEIEMKAEEKNWVSRKEGEYFVRSSGGQFARIKLKYYAGKRNFLVIESFLNPVSGQRSLEFDKSKQIDPDGGRLE